jgi:hypothetical protein
MRQATQVVFDDRYIPNVVLIIGTLCTKHQPNGKRYRQGYMYIYARPAVVRAESELPTIPGICTINILSDGTTFDTDDSYVRSPETDRILEILLRDYYIRGR